MNKKGFTLVEILGVVVILGLLFLVIAPPVINRVKTHETEVTDLQKQMVKEAADLYLDSHPNTTCISVQTLIDSGFLNENVDNATNYKITDKKVSVSITNNVRTFNIVNNCS